MKETVPSKPEYRVIPAGEFKAKCLQLMEEVNDKPLTFIITKRGKPVAQLSAPPNGLKLSQPVVELPTEYKAPVVASPTSEAESDDANTKRHKKRKGKKKHK